MSARTIMIQGTASDVGKSVLCTALCRIFADAGYRVAPFKSQNMALNSYITVTGGEIGRAQGVQAEAARVIPTTDMNPILLKPKHDMVAEVIVHGKRYADMDAKDYREKYVEKAMPVVRESLARLCEEFDVLVIEGAGSPAEINLKDRDIANMRIAHEADAPVILVADINRGGVFASIVGTLMLLDEEERNRVKGFVINKFRGRRDLLDDGLRWLEKETGIPVLGVLPYIELDIEAEDSLALSALRLKKPQANEFPIDVAILRFPRISNFTDFDPWFEEPDVGVRYVTSVKELGQPDVLILPGTKNTVEDLLWLQQEGFQEPILEAVKKGMRVIGICGGFQMLGETIFDPGSVEGRHHELRGLGLLPVETTFVPEKQTVQISGTYLHTGTGENSQTVTGYEIHLGRSQLTRADAKPFLTLSDGRDDGAISTDGRVWGTYLHGIFNNRWFTRMLGNQLREEKGLPLCTEQVISDFDRREQAYNQLAEQVAQYIDMQTLYEIMGLQQEIAQR